jgi:bifunctional DNase/RNase
MPDDLVEMVVESVRVHMLSSQHVVILRESDRERYLPIWIGPWEANAIAMRLQSLTPERPLTHDLFASVLEELGVMVRQVVIADLTDDTFHARLVLDAGGRSIEVDARPSDALALAVRVGVRIFVAESVMARAALVPDARNPVALALTGEVGAARVDPRLDMFRDFVNSLGQEPEGEHREGPAPEG